MGVKKLIKNIGVKGIFETIFPKAENTKIGRLASGIITGASHATPLTFFKDFAEEFFDSDGDGRITVKDFKDMDIKTFGKALGFLVVLFVGYYLLSKHLV